MKISIDTSSFSFRFIGILFVLIGVVVFITFSEFIGILVLICSILFIIQNNMFLITKKPARVVAQVEKTLVSINLKYEKSGSRFVTKTTNIDITNCYFFTLLHFRFDKMYTVQGKYLTEAVSKYQRYG